MRWMILAVMVVVCWPTRGFAQSMPRYDTQAYCAGRLRSAAYVEEQKLLRDNTMIIWNHFTTALRQACLARAARK